jgi:hypothetical protein
MNAVVTNALYINEFKVKIYFADGIKSIKVGYLKKYQNLQNLQNFMIQNGNIVWGEDWDLIFPRDQLYEEKIIV